MYVVVTRVQRHDTDRLVGELLWTDPQEMPGRGPSKRVCFLYDIFALTS